MINIKRIVNSIILIIINIGCSSESCDNWEKNWDGIDKEIITGSFDEWEFATGIRPTVCNIKKASYSKEVRTFLAARDIENNIIYLYLSRIAEYSTINDYSYYHTFNVAIMHELGHSYGNVKHNKFPNLMSEARGAELPNLCISSEDLEEVCLNTNCTKFNSTCN